MHGRKILCTIKGKPVKDAMIMYDSGFYYLLHNEEHSGDKYPGNFQGYKRSWGMGIGNSEALNGSTVLVENIQFLESEIY